VGGIRRFAVTGARGRWNGRSSGTEAEGSRLLVIVGPWVLGFGVGAAGIAILRRLVGCQRCCGCPGPGVVRVSPSSCWRSVSGTSPGI
jgi:hypothetical protein